MRLRYAPLLLVFGGLLLLPAGLWLNKPSYTELYVPIPSYHSHIWNNTSRASFSYTGRPGVEYLLRRDGTAYTDVVGWQSATDGLNYFDRWLGERGWERTEMYTQGDPVLPESSFLKFGQTYAVYTQPEDRSGFNGAVRGGAGRVTVAVWPIDEGDKSCECRMGGFNVVIVTTKPSLLKEFTDAFDD